MFIAYGNKMQAIESTRYLQLLVDDKQSYTIAIIQSIGNFIMKRHPKRTMITLFSNDVTMWQLDEAKNTGKHHIKCTSFHALYTAS